MLGGVLGCYIQGGVTVIGVLLFSVYGMCIYVYVYVYNYVHIACSSASIALEVMLHMTWYKNIPLVKNV